MTAEPRMHEGTLQDEGVCDDGDCWCHAPAAFLREARFSKTVTLSIPADYFSSAESREQVGRQFQQAIARAFEEGRASVVETSDREYLDLLESQCTDETIAYCRSQMKTPAPTHWCIDCNEAHDPAIHFAGTTPVFTDAMVERINEAADDLAKRAVTPDTRSASHIVCRKGDIDA
jgi:hypothetical protein